MAELLVGWWKFWQVLTSLTLMVGSWVDTWRKMTVLKWRFYHGFYMGKSWENHWGYPAWDLHTNSELEHGPVEIVDLPIKIMVIFHSYVSLPEGKPPFSYGFPMVFPLKPPFSYGKPPFWPGRVLNSWQWLAARHRDKSFELPAGAERSAAEVCEGTAVVFLVPRKNIKALNWRWYIPNFHPEF